MTRGSGLQREADLEREALFSAQSQQQQVCKYRHVPVVVVPLLTLFGLDAT